MKYRTREIYIQILEFLKDLFTQYFPEDPPFNPPAFHSDFESAFVSAVSHSFPTSTLQFCSFHWSQTMHRRLSIVRSKPTEDPILSEIWTLLKAVPYIPWSISIRDEFFRILDAKQELLSLFVETTTSTSENVHHNNKNVSRIVGRNHWVLRVFLKTSKSTAFTLHF